MASLCFLAHIGRTAVAASSQKTQTIHVSKGSDHVLSTYITLLIYYDLTKAHCPRSVIPSSKFRCRIATLNLRLPSSGLFTWTISNIPSIDSCLPVLECCSQVSNLSYTLGTLVKTYSAHLKVETKNKESMLS